MTPTDVPTLPEQPYAYVRRPPRPPTASASPRWWTYVGLALTVPVLVVSVTALYAGAIWGWRALWGG